MTKSTRKVIVAVVVCVFLSSVGLVSLRAGKRRMQTDQEAARKSSQPQSKATESMNSVADAGAYTPLMLAAMSGDSQTVKELIAKGTLVDEINAEGTTPLMCAASRGQTDIVRLLINRGSQVTKRNFREQTALSFAAKFGHEAAAKLLIGSGADVNTERKRAFEAEALEDIYGMHRQLNGGEPSTKRVVTIGVFGEALTNGHAGTAKLLLDNGAVPKLFGGEDANEVLRLVARKGYAELVPPLLKKGAQINQQHVNGRTALMEASATGQSAVVELLLELGAVVDMKDNEGQNALLLATRSSNVKSVAALLSHKAQVETADTRGRTALMIAAENGQMDLVAVLLKQGANKEAADRTGKTAAVLAEYYGHADIAKKLGSKSVDTGMWPN